MRCAGCSSRLPAIIENIVIFGDPDNPTRVSDHQTAYVGHRGDDPSVSEALPLPEGRCSWDRYRSSSRQLL
jgi:hypothetical protein